MNNSLYTLIANWKMYFSYDQTRMWLNHYAQELIQNTQALNFVLCASPENLSSLKSSFKNSSVNIGGQNCSSYPLGAHTGQISAQSLKEIGVSYCLVGHAETRNILHETNNILYQKLQQLITHHIIPIFCVGEPKEIYEENKAELYIQHQLEPIFLLLQNASTPLTIFIAYEPIWAIGTKTLPAYDYLVHIMQILTNFIKPYRSYHTIHLAYGGSITHNSLQEIKKIPELRTFLIGKASTDFQELKKIISLLI